MKVPVSDLAPGPLTQGGLGANTRGGLGPNTEGGGIRPSTYGRPPPKAPPAPSGTSSESFAFTPSQAEDWAKKRKAQPANTMLPQSLRWVASLPPNLTPTALVTQFPRIVNLLALQWTNVAACRAYFDDLLTDHRGTRKGFPADVYQEITALRDYHYTMHMNLRLED